MPSEKMVFVFFTKKALSYIVSSESLLSREGKNMLVDENGKQMHLRKGSFIQWCESSRCIQILAERDGHIELVYSDRSTIDNKTEKLYAPFVGSIEEFLTFVCLMANITGTKVARCEGFPIPTYQLI